jgi:hypothetical protein
MYFWIEEINKDIFKGIFLWIFSKQFCNWKFFLILSLFLGGEAGVLSMHIYIFENTTTFSKL